mmetsp:Transcript_53445/g.115513  ORF Transcript_53445/g.115513 Transcript_53445/m.115513 type:complete len:875 (-) Transcript_53445:149-2773(-)|eukprot:CAMPEP_0170597380 /NCGR_PEP_ID=MMETSP0224-20130122/15679_1 /TAXON_ID=285029 /ORGANISM="Togula jolla, Strain CCCM 725" /LENGTH=874 /DNA_ID=CAMNT_0010921853 /DNA_START=128 /DNA_END=2752 /DNA_ORIENTATION=+
MMLRLFLAVCAASSVLTAAQTSPSELAEDQKVAADASAKAELYCAGGFKGKIDRAADREVLEGGAGDDDKLRKILIEAEDSKDVERVAEEEFADQGFFLSKASALAFVPILLIIWLICCWTACPCCKCCRCGSKERSTPLPVKLLIALIVLVFFLVIIILGVMGMNATSKTSDGMENLGCTAAVLLNSTLSGNAERGFIGLTPFVRTLEGMEANLDPNSVMMNQISSLLDQTAPIEQATVVASGTLALLQNMLQSQSNSNPGDPAGAFMHECQFCSEVAPLLSDAITLLNNGVGQALTEARATVDAQLTGSALTDLRQSLSDGIKPMREMKNLVRDAFKGIVEGDDFETIRNDISSGQSAFTAVILVVLILLAICGCVSACLFVLREKSEASASAGRNPYNMALPCCSCWTWCCGFLVAALLLFIGGILIVLVVPQSSLCLIMEDMNRELLLDISPALEIDLEPNSTDFNTFADVLEKCFVDRGTDLTNMMDLIRLTANGTEQTMREYLDDTVNSQLTAGFDSLTAASSGDLAISSNEQIVALRSMFRDNPIDAFIFPKESLRDDPTYQAIAGGHGGVQVAFVTTTRCENHTVADQPPLQAGTLPGILNLVDTMVRTYASGQIPYGLTCAQNVICGDQAYDATDRRLQDNGERQLQTGPFVGKCLTEPDAAANRGCQACQAANRFIDLKRDLLTWSGFKCDIFQDASGADCDPRDMTRNPDGTWNNDCLRSGNVMVRREKACTLVEFEVYMRDFDERIRKVIERLDDAVPTALTNIDLDMRRIVKEFVQDPINGVVGGSNCNFLSDAYHGIIDGYCYQAVISLRMMGNSYAVCGFLILVTIICSYGIWRRSIDNVNSWEAGRAAGYAPGGAVSA